MRPARAALAAAVGRLIDWRERRRRMTAQQFNLAAIVEQVAAPAFVKSLDGRYEMVSRAFERQFAIPAGTAVGRRDREVHAPGEMAEICRRDAAVIAAGGPVVFEDEIPGEQGVRALVTTLYALRDRRGRARAVFGMSSDVTDLRMAENKFRSLLDASPEAMLCVDTDGNVAYANGRALAMFGYSREELLGASVDILVPQTRQAVHVGHRRRYFATPSARPMGAGTPLTARRKDGSEIPVDVSLAPVHADGRSMVLAAVQDVTERRRQAYTNARLAAIVAASQDAIVSKSIKGTIQTWNPGAERLYGYTAEEMVGSDVTRLLPPDRPDEEKWLLAKVFEGEAILRYETRRKRKDGRLISVSLSMAPMRDGSGAVIGASTVAHDITARINAENRLRGEREQLEMIMAAASDPFFTMDQTGKILEWNRQAERLFGWPRDDIVGRNVAETVLPHRYREALGMVLGGRWDWLLDRPTEISAMHRTGREVPVELTMWCIRQDDVTHFHGFVRDISARLETEHALAQARDQALETARLKSQFLAAMSHEIRTPMNGVLGLTGLLLDTALDTRQRRYAEGVSAAGSALLSVINDVLDFSKLEAGKVVLEETDFDLRRLIDEVIAIVATPDTADHVEVITRCDPAIPDIVRGDSAKLRQVLLNLAGNALKFTAHGHVTVEATRDDESGGEEDAIAVRFAVLDTGIGISDDQRELLFEPFAQAEAGTTRRFGGTGLGLSISQDLVEIMGGTITIDSVPGQGSTFAFTVVLRPAVAPVAGSDRHVLHGLRVLVVDGDDADRRELTDQLTAWSMYAADTADPENARAILRTAAAAGRPIDVVIQDVGGARAEDAVLTLPPDTPPPKTILIAAGPAAPPPVGDVPVTATLTKPLRQSLLYDALVGTLADDAGHRPGDGAWEMPPGSGHLLVVEDNQINRTVALGILEKLGYRADVAVNGREAVQKSLAHDYDAILMDCLMPELDGFEATEAIRARETAGQHVPIIALTASALAEDRAHCLAVGMDDHLAKPLLPQDVAAILHRWIGGRPGRIRTDLAPETVAGVAAQIGTRLDLLREQCSDPAVLDDLLHSFAVQIPAHLECLEAAAAAGDSRVLRTEAHQLKGVMANLGAEIACAACDRLETAARAGDLDAAAAGLAEVGSSALQVRAAVDGILAASRGQGG